MCEAQVHDTLWAYLTYRCRCPQALAAKAAAQTRYVAGKQHHTARHARAFAMPWTTSDDHELVHGTGTLVERASRLGRTYWAARSRLAVLRSQEAAQTI